MRTTRIRPVSTQLIYSSPFDYSNFRLAFWSCLIHISDHVNYFERAKTPPSRRLQVQGLLSESAEPSACAGSSKRKLNRTGLMQARTAAGSIRTSRSISKVGHISQARRAERRNKERGNKKTQPFESTCLRKNKSM